MRLMPLLSSRSWQGTTRPSLPQAAISRATSRAAGSATSSTATRPAARANRRAIARPMPDPPPSRARPCARSLSQIVHARRVVGVEPASLRDAPPLCEPLREAVPGAIIARQRQHRPVAAVQHALRAEALDHSRGVRDEILGAPGCSRLGEQSRQLAAHVLVRREPRDVGALIMAFLRNGCQQMGWPNYIQEIIIGGIIVLAVALDRLRAGWAAA